MPPPVVFVNCRDRVATLVELVSWLERAGCEEIHLLDNDSAYEPLLDYYERTPHTVVRLGRNYGRLALFEAPGVLDRAAGRPYVYTDPDVVPAPDCPLDALDHFAELLARYQTVSKAGFGLRIDDLPDHYAHKEAVLTWEQQFWERALEPGVYYAPVDTTFALYRPGSGFVIDSAIRTGPPYVARHDTWYLDLAHPGDEERFYRSRAAAETVHSPRTSHWSAAELPAALLHDIEALRRRVGRDAADGNRPELPHFEESGWFVEPEPCDEAAFTPWAQPGWRSWNSMSPEVEFTEFAGRLVRMLQPALVVETGVGQGYTTRRLAAGLGPDGRLRAYESDGYYRALLSRLPFFTEAGRELAPEPTPPPDALAQADLTILDADDELRYDEIRRWAAAARPGALVLVHDAGNDHPPGTLHHRVRALVAELGIAGRHLANPRGSFLGVQTGLTGPNLAGLFWHVGQITERVDAVLRAADERTAVDAETSRLAAENAALRAEVAGVRHELAAVRGSKSYRLTGPLRAGLRLSRSVRSRYARR